MKVEVIFSLISSSANLNPLFGDVRVVWKVVIERTYMHACGPAKNVMLEC